MAINDENGNGMVMPVQPMGNYGYPMGGFGGGFGNGWGGDGWWIILLLLCFNGGWGGMGGFGGFNGGLGIDFPWILNGQNQINANTNSGFDHAATQAALGNLQNAVTSGFGDVQTALCGGFAGVNAGVANGFAQAEIANNARQIANMQQAFAAQTATAQGFNQLGSQFADCCCENRLASADLKYTIATENCADRAALSDGIRDILAAQVAGFQSIKDQLCQDKIDAKNDEIAQLRQEVLYARGQASQIAQNQQVVDGIYDRLNTCPVGTTPVYGRTPIFTCNNGGCGCGNNVGGFNGTF